MATNLAIDPELIDLALEVSGERTKRAAVTKALEEFVARRKQKRLVDLMGTLEWDNRSIARANEAGIKSVCRHGRLVARLSPRRAPADVPR